MLDKNQFIAILVFFRPFLFFSPTIVPFEARAHLTPLIFQQPDQRSLKRDDQREGTTEEQEGGEVGEGDKAKTLKRKKTNGIGGLNRPQEGTSIKEGCCPFHQKSN